MKNILKYSIKNNLRHIPSALSQYSYLKHLLPKLDYKNTNISIGKPFGAQAYYTIWESMGLCEQPLSYGLKHEELDLVNFSEETLGNALGVASGLAYNNKKTYCNISDGALQMGSTLEAIQYIGSHKQNIFLTVDFNGMQLTDSIKNTMGIDVRTIENMFKIHGWRVNICDTISANEEDINMFIDEALDQNEPYCLIFKTSKGQGVKEMEEDPVLWHYKELKDINEITIIKNA